MRSLVRGYTGLLAIRIAFLVLLSSSEWRDSTFEICHGNILTDPDLLTICSHRPVSTVYNLCISGNSVT